MRRNLKRFGHYAAALALLCCLLPVPAGAAEAMPAYDGYIFKLREDMAPMSLMADEAGDLPQGISQLEFGYFKADDMETLAALTEAGWLEVVEPNYVMELMAAPNDPQYQPGKVSNPQWNLDAIDMSYAWDKGWTGEGVTVGVLDSGLVLEHEDMSYTGEHISSWSHNFVEDTTAIENIQPMTDMETIRDELGHGSIVSGIIGATTNNTLGIAGVAPKAQLMVFKFFGANRTGGTTDDMAKVIRYGTDKGCDIITMSLGAFLPLPSTYLQAAVDYALGKGVILIAAVGNGDTTPGYDKPDKYTKLSYPAACDGVIGVGALTKTANGMIRASYSQRNESVDVTAPGTGIYGLSAQATTGYVADNGTSFSTPTVAAAAALCKQADPELTPASFLGLLMQTSTDAGTEGWDEHYGYGMLNVSELLKAVEQRKDLVQVESKVNGVAIYGDSLVANGKLVAVGMEGKSILVLAAGYDANGQMTACTSAVVVAEAHGIVSPGELLLDLPALPDRVELLLLDPDTWAPLGEAIPCQLGTP